MIDEWLFGWDPTPGIVSVWADRDGRALIWRRVDERIRCERARYRPWLFARTLEDLAHLGEQLQPEAAPQARRAAITFRELDGPEGSYRFLLSAESGRLLERCILEGAATRLERPIESLYTLDEYYRVGPVEQYLMQTGRVYFRGMRFADLRRMQIDLETTALDPAHGRIFMAAIHDSHGMALTLEAPTPGDEARLITDLCRIVRERDPDAIENHNLFGFDLPFLESRAAALKVPLYLGRAEGPRRLEPVREPGDDDGRRNRRYSAAGRELLDTLDAVRRHDFVARDLPSHRLKDVARHFGIAAADRVYLAGADVAATYRSNPELVRRYALNDVQETAALAERLLTAPFALAQMAPRRFERLAYAGPAMGILEPLLVRAYLRSGMALPDPNATPMPDTLHAGGALYLYASGVAQHVVKADIASLYPSIMRVYRISPSCDRLGALLALVERLTDLRLEHKAATRTTIPGTLEHGYHQAMQAAMKLLINSAYGYLGAGRMAMFADREAADEITRRGRELLGVVVAALRTRGMALIEADTDGVFFGVPDAWEAEQERELVQQVAAELPDGIRLEYEGRYQAMLSHEVKNYALLTYGGELIIRGAAMKSSRSEPFGERFLSRALRCLLLGDIPGVQEAFLSTVADLQQRRLPAADLAARMRLTKTPAQYQAARQREAPYEALLAAGRTEWRSGERIRCYRSINGYTWLPDAAEGEAPPEADQRRDYDVQHYLNVLVDTYADRLRKAFTAQDFNQIFRVDGQIGLFDRPITDIRACAIE